MRSHAPVGGAGPCVWLGRLGASDRAAFGLADDEPAGQRPSHEIHFESFKKLHKFYIVEKTIEVYAPLRREQGSRLLGLDALWSPQEHGYQVAVYRQIDVPLAAVSCAAGQEGMGGHVVVHLWVPYDLTRSVLPTAELHWSR